jgi:hypothetical protein
MICPRCGIINTVDDEHCKRCGGSLARPPERPAEPEPVSGTAPPVPPVATPTGPVPTPPPTPAAEGQDAPPSWQAPPPPPPTAWYPPAPPPQSAPPTEWPPPEPPSRLAWPPPESPSSPGWPPPEPRPQGARGWSRPSGLPTYLPWAFLSLLIFWPGGIVAIVYGLQVNRRLSVGDVDGATRASHLAKTWCRISVVVGVVLLLLLASGVVRNPYSGG